VKDTVICYI